jgi:hypothetical protein
MGLKIKVHFLKSIGDELRCNQEPGNPSRNLKIRPLLKWTHLGILKRYLEIQQRTQLWFASGLKGNNLKVSNHNLLKSKIKSWGTESYLLFSTILLPLFCSIYMRIRRLKTKPFLTQSIAF